ncbi:MAG TPA: ABC transporter substrate binding protein, partial [Syntrophomonadaceae bacterium]|nr:ABC transporter substrate binding protein [Syntrophomonadaceae bacterium]
MKRLSKAVALITMMVLLLSLAGCTSNKESKAPESKGKIKIGIVQIVEHPSLNTIRESFISELAKEGYKDGDNIVIDYQNAQNDLTNLKTICQK